MTQGPKGPFFYCLIFFSLLPLTFVQILDPRGYAEISRGNILSNPFTSLLANLIFILVALAIVSTPQMFLTSFH